MDPLLGLPEVYVFYGGIAILAAVIIVPALVMRRVMRQDRPTALAKFAAHHGFSFSPDTYAWDEEWYTTFDLLAREQPREQRHILVGDWRGLKVAVLDYDYTPRGAEAGENETARRTVAIAYLTTSLPGIIIEPNMTNQLMAEPMQPADIYARSRLQDLRAETWDFQRRYVLMAEDQIAAGRLLHPEMETFLLEHWGIGVEIAGAAAVFFAARLLHPTEIKQLLDFAARFCELMPEHNAFASEQARDDTD